MTNKSRINRSETGILWQVAPQPEAARSNNEWVIDKVTLFKPVHDIAT